MEDKAKIIFWIGTILILIIGLFATYKSFTTASESMADTPIRVEPIFTILGFLLLIITIFFSTILLGLPFLKKEK
jgi:hypothetical protein